MVGAVNVFVDDAVQGRFPAVCARTGAPAESIERIDHRIGGPSALLLLLVFLGPIGWLALAIIYAASRTETLTVRLPVSVAAWEQERARRKLELTGYAVAATTFVLVLALRPDAPMGWLFAAVVVVALLVGIVTHIRSALRQPRISLDASRRWVLIGNVDSAFADAVREPRRDGAPAPRS